MAPGSILALLSHKPLPTSAAVSGRQDHSAPQHLIWPRLKWLPVVGATSSSSKYIGMLKKHFLKKKIGRNLKQQCIF